MSERQEKSLWFAYTSNVQGAVVLMLAAYFFASCTSDAIVDDQIRLQRARCIEGSRAPKVSKP